jgi:hypothetical protein
MRLDPLCTSFVPVASGTPLLNGPAPMHLSLIIFYDTDAGNDKIDIHLEYLLSLALKNNEEVCLK